MGKPSSLSPGEVSGDLPRAFLDLGREGPATELCGEGERRGGRGEIFAGDLDCAAGGADFNSASTSSRDSVDDLDNSSVV